MGETELVKPHPRRRRRQPAPTPDRKRHLDRSVDKENVKVQDQEEGLTVNRTEKESSVTTRKKRGEKHTSRSSKTIVEDDQSLVFDPESSAHKSASHAALKKIESANKAEGNPLPANKELWTCLAEASVSFSQKSSGVVKGSMLLEEHKTELLNMSRICIKAATSEKVKDESKVRNLRIAVHALRATSRIIAEESAKLSTQAIKLLHHCVVTSGDLFTALPKSEYRSEAGAICLASYEALGYLLLKSFSGSNQVAFKLQTSSPLAGSPLARTTLDVFPAPILEPENGDRIDPNDLESSPMSYRQVSKIGIHCTLSALSILCELTRNSILSAEQGLKGYSQFGNAFGALTAQSITVVDNHLETALVIERMISGISMPWILSQLISLGKDGVADALQNAQKVFRLLWELSSQLDKHCATLDKSIGGPMGENAIRRIGFGLRRSAILALLLCYSKRPNEHILQWRLPPKCNQIRKALYGRQLDLACACAWKAGALFAQNASIPFYLARSTVRTNSTPYEKDLQAIKQFHRILGDILDRGSLEIKTPPPSYAEYCMYRALHVGIEMTEKSKSSHHKSCILFNTPFYFGDERRCISCHLSSVMQHSSDDQGEVTLALICLAFYTHQEGGTTKTKDMLEDDHRKCTDAIISRFRKAFFVKNDSRSNDMSSRCYKLLSLLSLDTLTSSLLGGSHELSGNVKTLFVFGSILYNCIAPLASSETSKLLLSEEPTLNPSFITAVEAYSRAALAFDQVHELTCRVGSDKNSFFSKNDDITELANKSMHDLHTTLCNLRNQDQNAIRGTFTAVVERAAKTLSSIGYKRTESQVQDGLLPLLYASDLFSQLIDYTVCGNSYVDPYKLSLRLSNISQHFQSLGMLKEACLGHMAAISCSITHGSDMDNASNCLLCAGTNKSEDGKASENGNDTQTSVVRLVRCYCQLIGSPDRGKNPVDSEKHEVFRQILISICRRVGLLPNKYIFTSDNAFTLARITELLLLDGPSNGSESFATTRLEERMKVVREIIKHIGMHIQMLVKKFHLFAKSTDSECEGLSTEVSMKNSEKESISGLTFRVLSNELKDVVLLGLSFIEEHCDASDPSAMIKHHQYAAALNFVAASALLSTRSSACHGKDVAISLKGETKKENCIEDHFKCKSFADRVLVYAKKAQDFLLAILSLSHISEKKKIAILSQIVSVGLFLDEAQDSLSPTPSFEGEYEEGNIYRPQTMKLLSYCLRAGKYLQRLQSGITGHTSTLSPETENACYALVQSTSCLVSKLEYEGNLFSAAQGASCLLTIDSFLSTGEDGRQLKYVADYATFLLSSGLFKISTTVLNHFTDNIDCIDYEESLDYGKHSSLSLKRIREYQLYSIQLSLDIRMKHVYASNSSTSRLRDILNVLQQNIDDAPNCQARNTATAGFLSILQGELESRWTACLCLSALAEAADKCGDVRAGLTYLRRSSQICQHGLDSLRRTNAKYPQKPFYSRDEYAMNSSRRFLACLSSCFQKMSILYSRLGDHRKASGYILHALDSLKVSDLTADLDSNLFALFDTKHRFKSFATNRQVMCYRLFHELKALRSTPETICTAMERSTATGLSYDWETFNTRHALSLYSDGSSPKELNWHLEYVRALTSHGDILRRSSSQSYRNIYMQLYTQALSHLEKISSSSHFRMICDESWPTLIQHENVTGSHEENYFEYQIIELKMKLARALDFEDTNNGQSTSIDLENARKIYSEVSISPFTSGISRGWALYRLGLIELRKSRHNGELLMLWDSHSISGKRDYAETEKTDVPIQTDGAGHLSKARHFFTRAAAFSGPSSHLLSRKILRSLALTNGPDNDMENVGSSAATLVHSSIGSSVRQLVSRAYSKLDSSALDHEQNLMQTLFESFDEKMDDTTIRNTAIEQLFEICGKIIPQDWRFVAITLCPTGEILLAVISMNASEFSDFPVGLKTICIFAEAKSAFSEIVEPLKNLIERSQKHLSKMATTSEGEKYSDETSKRKWWNERVQIDQELQNLIKKTEQNYFGAACIHDILFGTEGCYEVASQSPFSSRERFETDVSSSNVCGDLFSKFEAASKIVDDKIREVEDTHFIHQIKAMTVVQLRHELAGMGVSASKTRKLKKASLIDLVISQRKMEESEARQSMEVPNAAQAPRRSSFESVSSTNPQKLHVSDEPCLFLILDEHFQQFPFEGMSVLNSKTVSRIPSLPFAVASLMEETAAEISDFSYTRPFVDPAICSLVLDPESNLSKTQERMSIAIENLTKTNAWNWNCCIGRHPSRSFMEEGLSRENGLFLYCGHGGGERSFSRSQVETLFPNGHSKSKEHVEPLERRCRSSVILMGCSSGKLSSVNCSDTSRDVPIFYEPEGIALSYICAGAPCVVGNLWDVTDRDIDRYCITLLESFLSPDQRETDYRPSLPKCVADARDVCKMRFIVGCAPVCYGVPVRCLTPVN